MSDDENHAPAPESLSQHRSGSRRLLVQEPDAPQPDPREKDWILWIFIGPNGLRCGWTAGVFIVLYEAFERVFGTLAVTLFPSLLNNSSSPTKMLEGEMIPLAAVVGAGLILCRLEGRRIGDYNLAGARRALAWLAGAACGFAFISFLLGSLKLGGWVQITAGLSSPTTALKFGMEWAAMFLLVGFTEEGAFRCCLLASLTRGITFWWAIAAVAGICGYVALAASPRGAMGVYLFVALGLPPCAWVQWRKISGAQFWFAAWVTSALFGAVHTGNPGENWIGIFSAAEVGFVFCASIKLTGSAWWAIGCHAAWDWGQSYFYGTPDSGMLAKGHLLNSTFSGPAIWSGGADGPEGSLLIIPVVLLILVVLVLIYGRKKNAALTAGQPAS